MRIIHEPKYDFDDVLMVPKRSTMNSRSEVTLERSFTFRWSNETWEGLPLIAANMDRVGTFQMARILRDYNMLTAIHKHYTVEQYVGSAGLIGRQNYFYTMGIRPDDYEKFKVIRKQLYPHHPCMICIDAPSAYIEKFVEHLKKVRDDNPNSIIMAGNVVTAEMTEALILAGADIVKVGIGSGAMCLTRRVAGVGVPQLSAVIECADAAHGIGGHVCSDGGIVYPGDIGKAFGAGADFIMLGTVLAGHKEGGGEIIKDELTSQKFVKFHGMSSHEAQKEHTGEIKKYRASEGREELIPYKPDIHSTLQEYIGGLRSTMTYIGARKIKSIPKCTNFIVVNKQLNTSVNS